MMLEVVVKGLVAKGTWYLIKRRKNAKELKLGRMRHWRKGIIFIVSTEESTEHKQLTE